MRAFGHLNEDQFSACLAGETSPAADRHLRDCAACRAELESFEATLADFRGAVRAWSEDRAGALRTSAAVTANPRHGRQLIWAVALAALFAIASLVLPRFERERSAGIDAALLNRVDAQVSRSVPSSLEPLTRLVIAEGSERE